MTTYQPYPGISLPVAESGAGRPALLLHGGAGPDSAAPLAEHLAGTGHRVLTPTHPGWAGVPRPDWFTGVDTLVETYLDLLDDRELTGVTVLGSSFGGWLAAELALRDRGRRIGRLVLLDAIGADLPGHTLQLPGGGLGGPMAGMFETLHAYGGPDLRGPALAPRLHRLRVPVLVLWGEQDTVATPAYGRDYAAVFPAARFEPIPGGGHLPFREAPAATFTALDSFLR